MSERTPYVHANPDYYAGKIRLACRDLGYGRISREEFAELVRTWALEIEKKVMPDTPSLFVCEHGSNIHTDVCSKCLAGEPADINERVKAHLRKNRMIR